MTVSIRLDRGTERQLAVIAESEGISKSEVIRRCLQEYLRRRRLERRPWELGEDLFGKEGSGRSDLSRRRKQIVRGKVHARKSRR